MVEILKVAVSIPLRILPEFHIIATHALLAYHVVLPLSKGCSVTRAHVYTHVCAGDLLSSFLIANLSECTPEMPLVTSDHCLDHDSGPLVRYPFPRSIFRCFIEPLDDMMS
jgi:hypothetical protein